LVYIEILGNDEKMTENMPKKSSKTMWYVIAIVVVVVIIIGGSVYYVSTLHSGPSTSPPPSGTTQLTLYEGEISQSSYGFGNSASGLLSPGPTITLVSGKSYTMTVNNVGAMPHNWAIVSDKGAVTTTVFGAVIRNAGNPIPAGQSDSVTFTAGVAGNYFYVCQIGGQEIGRAHV
jgi:plastocyanin